MSTQTFASVQTPAFIESKVDQSLVGSWFGIAISTTAPLPPLKSLITFNPEGTILESRRLYLANSPLGPMLSTPAHGAWKKTGNKEFDATIVLLYQGADNHPTAPGENLAQEKVCFHLTLDESENHLLETFLFKFGISMVSWCLKDLELTKLAVSKLSHCHKTYSLFSIVIHTQDTSIN